jgi:ribulose-bisphosphate carboxylase large chain
VTIPPVSLHLSGDRLKVTYRLTGDETAARAKADDICIEQTVECPAHLIPAGDIRDQIFGRVEHFERRDNQVFVAVISYAVEITGFELKQLLNVLFGNISIKPGIRIEKIDIPETLLQSFRGPRFGIAGLRILLGEEKRPLLCTALKPLGLSARQMADQAYQYALGGIDIIKDDHSLADQTFAPFKERVSLCSDAVNKANRETGLACRYFPSLTASPDNLVTSAIIARNSGVGGLLVSPGLVGLDAMRMLADDNLLGLPIMSHPAFQGSLVVNSDHGIAHGVLFGQIARLAGADASIFPNFGGRFSFSREECVEIADHCRSPLGAVSSIFPTPGGGMNLGRVVEMREVFGNDVIFLIGGALHEGDGNLMEASRRFHRLVGGSV